MTVPKIMKATLLAAALFLTTTSAFAYDKAKMSVGTFDGHIFTRENVKIETVKVEAAIEFCWGICGGGRGKTKQIKIVSRLSPDQSQVVFRSTAPVKLSASDWLGGFRNCAVRVTVKGKDALGNQISATGNLTLSSEKLACARGAATPIAESLELISYVQGKDLRIFHLVHSQ